MLSFVFSSTNIYKVPLMVVVFVVVAVVFVVVVVVVVVVLAGIHLEHCVDSLLSKIKEFIILTINR